MTYKVIRS